MNAISPCLIKHIFRDLRHREIRMLLVALLIFQTVVMVAATLCFSPEVAKYMAETVFRSALTTPVVWTCIWGAGIIGIKISRGTLALILSRPISTTTFVVSSWLALALASFLTHLVYLATVSLQLLVTVPFHFDPEAVAVQCINALGICLGSSAILVFFSTLLSGVKDLGLYFVMYVLAQLLSGTTEMQVREIKDAALRFFCQGIVDCLCVLGSVIQFCVVPNIAVSFGNWFNWNVLVNVIGLIALIVACLAMAIARLNTLEVSYAAD